VRRAVLGAAVTAVVALLVGTVVVLKPPDAPAVDPVQERLPELIAFVEAERGLQLRRPIDVKILPDERTSLADSSERLLAFLSLVEGNAQRVERAWYDSRPAAVRAEIDAVDGLSDDRYTPLLPPDPIVSENDFPYQAGLRLVDALDDGPPAFPPAPEQDGQLIDEGVLGERGLALLLGLDPLEGGPQEGWEGDSYRTNRRPDGQVCTAARVVMSSGPVRDRLLDALQQVQLMVTAEGTVRLRLSSCA